MNEQMITQHQYNAFVLAQVNTDGWQNEETCPDCGKMAIRRDFESCHTGSVNAHYTLNCSHCGYHECEQDECSICDVKYDHNQHINDEVGKWLSFMDLVEDRLAEGRCVPGVLWTQFKHVMYHQPAVADLLDNVLGLGLPANCGRQVVHHVQRHIMDVRFKLNLEQRIQLAKLN
ncbi:hypothetical protein VSVS12_04404 (plasmid) [Vibrio scophthalmi]|uniref:Uncharacterized protein n=3 Tax=Vibrio TaxID=662 RepID=F9S5Y2_9VIBR|nr:hypothetical protein VSVS12_04404 [Vibrio scophthalmi]EGU34606.1 hypothetical protein VII00023_03793 [Vibrio ichthyoenteri ATCC 700023]